MLEKLKRLKALADQGIGGEKENAQKLLDALMHKHNISPGELGEDVLVMEKYRYKNTYERDLLVSVIGKVLDTDAFSYRQLSKAYLLEVTREHDIEIRLFYDIYRAKINEELRITFSAFIIKNRIFSETSMAEPSTSSGELSERSLKIMERMGNIDKVDVNKQIEA